MTELKEWIMKNKVGRPSKEDSIRVSFRLRPEIVDIIDEYWEATGAANRTEAVENLIQMMEYYTNKV